MCSVSKRVAPEPFWCEYFSGARAFSGVSTFLVPELLVSALFWCQSLFWCQHFSGARAFFWCQHFSGARAFYGVSPFLAPEPFLVSALFWCQSLFWCQHFSGARAFLVPAFFLCLMPFFVEMGI
jgi:hypothetical protein